MTLFFGSDEKVRCIAHPATKEDLYETINKFLKEKNYKSHYTRTFALTDTVTCYDVGSWTQFFYSVDKDIDIPEEWEYNSKTEKYDPRTI